MFKNQVGVKRVILKVDDLDSFQANIESIKNRYHEVVGDWAGNRDALKRECDGVGFGNAHPDWKVAFSILFLEEGNPFLVGKTDTDTIDNALDHFSHDAPNFLFVMVSSL